MSFTRKALFAGATVATVLALPGVALADSCSNVSRAAPACDPNCTSPYVVGNWVWLPSIGAPEGAGWGFSPPGSLTSIQAGLPNANGNYLNQQGNFSWLLENSAYCNGGAQSRQTSHGVQSGCGAD